MKATAAIAASLIVCPIHLSPLFRAPDALPAYRDAAILSIICHGQKLDKAKRYCDRGHRMKNIAVIGAGISGLAAAYLLSRRHRVQLFEKAERLGGHTNTVIVPT